MQTVRMLFRSFKTRDKDFMVNMFKVFVRSKLEYCSQVWNPQYISDIDLMESVQRYFTRRLYNNNELSYTDRLNMSNLESLELRRLQQDLILTYKLIRNKMAVNFRQFFSLKSDMARITRGHIFQIYVVRSKTNIASHFFSRRVVSPWNFLPDNVVSASSVASFKSRLQQVDLSRFLKGNSLR